MIKNGSLSTVYNVKPINMDTTGTKKCVHTCINSVSVKKLKSGMILEIIQCIKAFIPTGQTQLSVIMSCSYRVVVKWGLTVVWNCSSE